MISPPMMAPRIDSKPPRISTGRAFSATNVSAYCTPFRTPHITPATSATKPATAHTIAQMCCSGMPTASAPPPARQGGPGGDPARAPRWGAPPPRAPPPAAPRLRKDRRDPPPQPPRHERGKQVELADVDVPVPRQPLHRHVRDAELQTV